MTKFYLHSCTLTLTRPPDCGCPENVLVQKALLLKTKCEIEDLRYILLTLKHYCMNNIVKNFCGVLYETVLLFPVLAGLSSPAKTSFNMLDGRYIHHSRYFY